MLLLLCMSIAARADKRVATWYDATDLDASLQELRQHHVHPVDPQNPDGPRVPLDHCRRRDNPTQTKCGFPKTLLEYSGEPAPLVLCAKLLERLGLPAKG